MKKHGVTVLLSALLVSSPTFGQQPQSEAKPATVSSPPPASGAPPEKGIVLPNTLMDGTPVKLRLGRTVSSGSEKVGNEVDFEVLDEMKVNDVVVVPKGALAMATVTEAEHKKNMGRAGKLDINIDSVRLADGEKAALRATEGGKGQGHAGAMTGAIVATSIVFFPAAPLFLFIHGKDMTIPKGTEITAYVNGDMPLQMAKFAPAETIAPAAAAALAQLTVDSAVPNCDIEIDGVFTGNTPSQLSVTPGLHKVSVSKKGFQSWTKSVMVSGASVHLHADLEADASTVAGPKADAHR